MISGEYEIDKNEIDHYTFTERTIEGRFCVVTDERGDKTSEKFFEELQELLNKYAI